MGEMVSFPSAGSICTGYPARPKAGPGVIMGGGLALWSATFCDRIRAAVGFYPTIPWEKMNPEWHNYAGKAAVIHCSEQDGTSAAPGIQAARLAIENAGGTLELLRAQVG